jgi:FMN-dependent NADH-azoreductase
VPEDERTSEQGVFVARSSALVDELLAADVVLISVPLYNWDTPASVKTWIGHLMSDARTRDPEGLLRGRSLVLVNAQGGSYRRARRATAGITPCRTGGPPAGLRRLIRPLTRFWSPGLVYPAW